MHDLGTALRLALDLIVSGDAILGEIVSLSLTVSLSAVLLACAIGLPLGAALAVFCFRGRNATIVCVNALMGLPPVAVGLFVYLLLSNSGPLGVLGLLYTPTAMIIAQTALVTPIIAALSRQILEDLHLEYREQLRSRCRNAENCSPGRRVGQGCDSPRSVVRGVGLPVCRADRRT